ncbi:glycosyltransferase family 2 protein [Pseudoalteromonas sp. SIMBA_148]
MSNAIDISVVIAAWNAEDFILTAINSALSQEGVSVEVIVIDDASTDNTCNVVESIIDSRVKLLRSEANGGPGAARNIGFDAAKGTWIAVLDSDDSMSQNRLKNMLGAAPAKADVLIDNFCELSSNGILSKPFYSHTELPLGRLNLSFLIETNLVFTGVKSTGYVKPLFKNEFVKKHSIKYWPEVKIGEDYYFLASCLAQGANAEVLNEAGYVYTVRDGSISSKLEIEHIDKLLNFDKKFIREYHLSDLETSALKIRNKNLKRAFHYLVLIEQIKARRILSALLNIICNLPSALLLILPIKKRLLFWK